MSINPKAVDLWRQYQAETDPTAEEMLRQAYLRALDDVSMELLEEVIRKHEQVMKIVGEMRALGYRWTDDGWRLPE